MRSEPLGILYSKLDRPLDVPVVVADSSERTSVIGVSPSPNGCVGSVVQFPVFQMDMRNSVMMFFDGTGRGENIIARDEVPQIDVRRPLCFAKENAFSQCAGVVVAWPW